MCSFQFIGTTFCVDFCFPSSACCLTNHPLVKCFFVKIMGFLNKKHFIVDETRDEFSRPCDNIASY